jgi:spore coat-associated protein N
MLRPTTDRTRTRARHRWACGAFLRLEVLALVVVAICLVILSSSSTPARAELQLASSPGDSLTLSNDKEGAAILSLGGMRPGDSVTDTVTLGNTGTVPGDLSLSTSNLLDTPGAGGGALSGELDLVIRDVTNLGSPLTVYSGKIDALTPVTLGTLAAGASRVYEFRVSFPDAGAGAENAFQGSAVSVQFDWTAVNNDADTDAPETTITSGPASLSASPDAN